MKSVSVCIPAFNSVPLLQRSLGSALSQDYGNFEIVVSDDSLDDAVESYVREYSDRRIRYVRNSPSLGSPKSWNRAIDLAEGEYIKLLHHDDFFTSRASLSAFMHEADQSGAAFIFSASLVQSAKDRSQYISKPGARQLRRIREQPEFLFFRNLIGAPSAVCFKKEKDFRFHPDFRWLVDVEFYMRYLRAFPSFAFIPDPLVTVVAGEEGQITGSVLADRKTVLAENIALLPVLRAAGYEAKKVSLFFQELFEEAGVSAMGQLVQKGVEIPAEEKGFLQQVIAEMSQNRVVKRLKKRFYTSRYNKQVFKLERF